MAVNALLPSSTVHMMTFAREIIHFLTIRLLFPKQWLSGALKARRAFLVNVLLSAYFPLLPVTNSKWFKFFSLPIHWGFALSGYVSIFMDSKEQRLVQREHLTLAQVTMLMRQDWLCQCLEAGAWEGFMSCVPEVEGWRKLGEILVFLPFLVYSKILTNSYWP